MPKSLTLSLVFLCATLTFGAPAGAASFNCAKAAHPDEHAICANPKLSELDVEMATLFKVRMEIPMLMGERGAARDEQASWLQKRSACGGNVTCLTSAYEARIDELNKIISTAMHDYCVAVEICG